MGDIIQTWTGGNVTIQAALIAAMSVPLSAIVSYIMAKTKIKEEHAQFEQSLKNQKTIKYKELITSERIKWLKGLRDDIANIGRIFVEINIAIIKHDTKVINDDLFIEQYFRQFIELQSGIELIKLKINPNKCDYIKVLDAGITVTHLMWLHKGKEDYREYKDKYLEYVKRYNKCSQEMLKNEWEIIKKEANQLFQE